MFDPTQPFDDLPPITSFFADVPPDVLRLAEDTHVALALLDYAVLSIPSPDLLLNTLTLQEARASSAIENISTTNDDLYRGVVQNEFTTEAKEVADYRRALLSGYSVLKEKGSLSLSDLESVNAFVNTKSAGIRTNLSGFQMTRIVRTLSEGETEILYTPPHGKTLLQSLLLDLLDFVYDDDLYPLHPLIKIALAHYQFESIHPFRDGNGRTGRILNVLFLCQKQYLTFPVLYASAYINRTKNEYYRHLREVREKDSYTEIIRYILLSFKDTAEQTLRIVEGVRDMVTAYSDEAFLNRLKGQREPLREMIGLVFRQVYVRVADVVSLGIHRQTAALYLDQLVTEGLLTKEKNGKENIYKNVKLLSLFDRD